MNASISGLTTEELAAPLGMKPQSIRVRLCQTGSYFGLRPQKLPNGRLMWPADSLERLLETGKEEGVTA
jgi:hypothetical protein|tara:strand:- start:541 stop:747 length:207 start_codon:yes stop_codon:yes gene_type:complete